MLAVPAGFDAPRLGVGGVDFSPPGDRQLDRHRTGAPLAQPTGQPGSWPRRSSIGRAAVAIRSCTRTSWSRTWFGPRTDAGQRSTVGSSMRKRAQQASSTRRRCERSSRECSASSGRGWSRARRRSAASRTASSGPSRGAVSAPARVRPCRSSSAPPTRSCVLRGSGRWPMAGESSVATRPSSSWRQNSAPSRPPLRCAAPAVALPWRRGGRGVGVSTAPIRRAKGDGRAPHSGR